MMLENAGMVFRKKGRLDDLDMLDNPDQGFGGLMLENQAFTMSALRAWGTAAAGVGFGLVFADFLDRFVATRKPSNGQHPWYGANAAAAQNRRPDAWRLGSQAAGGLGSMGLAYATRGRGIVPWLLGGAAIGFGANIVKMLINWWAMPMLVKVQNPNEASFANRMYPLEQRSVQDIVDGIFEQWQLATNLNANQQATPVIRPVAPNAPQGPVYTLGAGRRGMQPQYMQPQYAPGQVQGKGQTQAEVGNPRAGQPVLVKTGRLGMCPSCGGKGGCWNQCPDLRICGDCPDQTTAQICSYVVKPTDARIDDILEFFCVLSQQQHGDDRFCFDLQMVHSLNQAQDSSQYWIPGRTVLLPNGLCMALEQQPVPTDEEIMIPEDPVTGCRAGWIRDPRTGRCRPSRIPVPGQELIPGAIVPGGGPVFPPFEEVRGTVSQTEESSVDKLPPPVQRSALPFELSALPDEE